MSPYCIFDLYVCLAIVYLFYYYTFAIDCTECSEEFYQEEDPCCYCSEGKLHMTFCPTILVRMILNIYFDRIACVGKLCFAILVESHRIPYHVLCSPFIKMRILYECLANCLVDVGHGFSKNKIFYEN